MKAAVYAATRNLYPDLVPAVKSLLANSDVEKIYLLLEDDQGSEWLPPECEIINVSGQSFFTRDTPNFNSNWTYMTLLKSVYHRIFPDLDRILSLDVDTLVMQDISHLWDLDLTGAHFAGVMENTVLKPKPGERYFNAGVLMLNLDYLRETGRGDEVVHALQRRRWAYPEQDAYNIVCQPATVILPSEYNAGPGTAPYGEPIIRHFMGEHDLWRITNEYRYYKKLSWEEARGCRF